MRHGRTRARARSWRQQLIIGIEPAPHHGRATPGPPATTARRAIPPRPLYQLARSSPSHRARPPHPIFTLTSASPARQPRGTGRGPWQLRRARGRRGHCSASRHISLHPSPSPPRPCARRSALLPHRRAAAEASQHTPRSAKTTHTRRRRKNPRFQVRRTHKCTKVYPVHRPKSPRTHKYCCGGGRVERSFCRYPAGAAASYA